MGARHFILITGWSVWTDTVLCRPPAAGARCPPLGELLLQKAEEGVQARAAPRAAARCRLMRVRVDGGCCHSAGFGRARAGRSHPAHTRTTTPAHTQVLLLVWDDASNNLGLHPGLMVRRGARGRSVRMHMGAHSRRQRACKREHVRAHKTHSTPETHKQHNRAAPHPTPQATHDQETYHFFKGTKVRCVLCPRQGGSEDSMLQVRAARRALR